MVRSQHDILGVESQFDRKFTAREYEVLWRLYRGKSNKRIAYDLNMAEGTVKVHVRNIMRKSRAKNRRRSLFFAKNYLINE